MENSSDIVCINNTKIGEKSVCRFLGVTMDNKLKWSQHIIAVRTKISITPANSRSNISKPCPKNEKKNSH